MTFNSLLAKLNEIWMPLYLGSLLAGLFFATIGYISMRIIWRMHVVSQWEKRRAQRLANKEEEL